MTTNAAIQRIVAAKRIGPFRIVSPLGEGGFAPVFLASEEYGGVQLRSVALKLFAVDDLSPMTTATGGERAVRSARDRILEEARAICRVDHPNVVRFFQIVEEGEVLALAMEHVRGRSLSSRIDEDGGLPVDETLAVGAAVASALAAVHAAGLVHRDVKPPNVIESGGVYKLIDFGIALRARTAVAPRKPPSAGAISIAPASMPISRTGTTLESPGPMLGATMPIDGPATDTVDDALTAGTMGYIDPACIARELPADASSDLYSLGALLYECLTGRVPAAAGERAETTRLRPMIVLGVAAPPGVRTLRTDVPEDVAKMVDSLVAPAREDRPQRADAVAAELLRLARIVRGRARPLPADGPFRGLAPVDAAHRDVYFGRALAVAAALELLRSRGVVALVGASGAGKTSLALAGVVPSIADGELGAWPEAWRSVAFSPGRAPRDALAQALGIEVADKSADDVARDLAAGVTARGEGLLVIVDALEELVTTSEREQARWLGALLASIAARPALGLRVVCTARRDLLDPLLGGAELGAVLARGMQLVAPLDARAWIDSVRDRAAAYGVALEDGVEDALAAELGDGPVPLPLVEFAMAQAWAARDVERKLLPRAAFAAMGGLGGALARHADDMIASLVREHGAAAEEAVRHVLLALTTPHGTRARLSRRELADRVAHPLRDVALAALERARLVTADDDLTLAHDALVTRWPRLAAWVLAVRRDRELAADLEAAATRWRARPARDNLVRGRTLQAGRAIARAGTVRLSDDARALLRASARDELRGRIGVLSLLASVVLAGVVLAWAYRSSEREAEDEKERAAQISRTLLAAKNTPKSQVEKAIEDLLAQKNACEKELARCGDGGAR